MRLSQLAYCAGLGLSLVTVACGGGSGDDDDDDSSSGASGEAGDTSTPGGSSGAGGTGGTGGAAGKGGTGGTGGGTGGGAGSGAGSGATGGSVGGAGGTGGTGGSSGSPMAGSGPVIEALSPEVDPSRISTLPTCALSQNGVCVTPITRTKDEVCQKFAEDWPKKAPSGYTLPDDACTPATLDDEAVTDTIRRINLYRWFSALPPLVHNEEWATYAEACSAIEAHLDAVDHYPPETSQCWTELGYGAAAQSLLAMGENTPADSIDDLIWDFGDNNSHVLGHRWWLLHPGLTEVGIGFTYPEGAKRATCVRSSEGNYIGRPEDLTGIVAYPSFGIVPYALISREAFARPIDEALQWSITFPDEANVSGGSVRIYRETSSGYQALAATSGPFIRDFTGLWISPSVDPVEPGTYLMLVSGTSLGEFGYRTTITQCGAERPLTCDVLDQDCGVSGYACYSPGSPFCAQAGSLPAGSPCLGNAPYECEEGSACVEDFLKRDDFACTQYCDPNGVEPALDCQTICPYSYIIIPDETQSKIIGGYCEPSAGTICDPLAAVSECPANQGCYSWDPPHCLPVGTIGEGQDCNYTNDCVPGLACIGDGTSNTCEPYCDLEGSGADACATLCPSNYYPFDDFGICVSTD